MYANLSIGIHFLYLLLKICEMGFRETVDAFDYQSGKSQGKGNFESHIWVWNIKAENR